MVVWYVVCGWSKLAVQRAKEEVLMAGGGRLESNVQRANNSMAGLAQTSRCLCDKRACSDCVSGRVDHTHRHAQTAKCGAQSRVIEQAQNGCERERFYFKFW